MRYSVIASKYVKALLIVGQKLNKIEKYGEFLSFVKDIYENFATFFNNPIVKPEQKVLVIKQAFEEVFKESPDEAFLNFINIVFENKREKFIPQMQALYKYAAIDIENKILVNVKTAVKLSDQEIKVINDFVEKYVGKTPVIEETIDESLIAGAVIEFAGKMIDVSIKGRMDKIAKEVFFLRKG